MERIKLNEEEIVEMLCGLPVGWYRVGDRIRKEYVFSDFIKAFSFIVEVAIYSQVMNHHPKIVNVFNRVELELWTYDLGGLSNLDFALARQLG